jgi:hypothetical protein
MTDLVSCLSHPVVKANDISDYSKGIFRGTESGIQARFPWHITYGCLVSSTAHSMMGPS